MKKQILIPLLSIAFLMANACNRESAPTGAKLDGLAVGGLRVAAEAKFYSDSDMSLTVRVADKDGNPVAAKVTGKYTMPAMGSMAEMRGVVPFGEPGPVHEVRFEFDMAGKWFMRLGVEAKGESVELHYAVNTISRTFLFERSVPPVSQGQAAGDGAALESKGSGVAGIPLSNERRQLIGVTFETAEVRPLHKSIRAFGRVLVSEQSLVSVNVRAEGWVKELYVKTTGARVRKGDPLLTIFSPELTAAQQEYLIALQPGADDALRNAGVAKLLSLGMSQVDINKLRASKKVVREVILRSPQDGIVISKDVVVGAMLQAGMTAFQIGNLGKIWVLADLFEQDAPLVKEGYKARVKLAATTTEMVGKVGYVYPEVDVNTRTLPVRLEFRNAAGNLKPGMYVDVYIDLPPVRRLTIPLSAVLVTGEHRYAFVDRADGSLEPREIETGLADGEMIEVLSGIEAGERVSSSANFLISSEALLQNALPKWKGEVRGETAMPAALPPAPLQTAPEAGGGEHDHHNHGGGQ